MQCPFCKETIQDGAIKCKHCGSMLNSFPEVPLQSSSNTLEPIPSNIDLLKVSDVWKTRFKAFQDDKQYESKWWGYHTESSNPIFKCDGIAVFNKDNYISWWAGLFCVPWYFIKGMWKKGIVLIIISTICGAIGAEIGGKYEALGFIVTGSIALLSASYDYYRSKVLKQSFWW